MARRADRMAAVEVQIPVTFTRPDPCALAPLDGDVHFLVSCYLEPVFAAPYLREYHYRFLAAHGLLPVN